MTNGGRYWGETSGHGSYFAELRLDPELHASFCRRGRRRLKEIQMSSRAQLKFDRSRGVLRVAGSEAQVAEVQRQLECLGGPRKTIRNAAWAELMRTRMSDASCSVVQRIQQLSNCRVHIERTSKEVRLFGPKVAVAAASHLLDELQQMCIETLVEFDAEVQLSGEKIQQIAQQQCVTIVFEEGDGPVPRANVLGFEFAVSSALSVLQQYETNPKMKIQEGISEPVLSSLAAALSKLSLGENESGASTTGSTTRAAPAEDSDASSEGLEAGETGTANQGVNQNQQSHQSCCNCPTCGATNFCVSCGSPNEQFQFFAMNHMKAMPMGSQGVFVGNMQGPMGPMMSNVGMGAMQPQVFGVCMPMQLPQMMMPAEAGPGPASGSDGQVYLVPMMQPSMMT